MHCEVDILIIGAGPAGAASAILMAQSGRRVTVIERDLFPRQKVCGECVAAGNLDLLDSLGIGIEFRRCAGPELRQVGWIGASQMLSADMPACAQGNYSYGRAMGRDQLDNLLLERARAVGATVLQPATVEAIRGNPGHYECDYSLKTTQLKIDRRCYRTLTAAVVIDAHGSWERGPVFPMDGSQIAASRRRNGDLFAFKATFRETQLPTGFLPIIPIDGGYAGMVVANEGRTTIACCLRRDRLAQCRSSAPGASAGTAIEFLLRRTVPHLGQMLHGARRDGVWQSVGPVRPGIHAQASGTIFRIGNAAGESHPIIGEGIGMALQSAVLLANEFAQVPGGPLNPHLHSAIQERYSAAWRRAFAHRLSLSKAYDHMAMHPSFTRFAGNMLRRWPRLLTYSARWAGKAQHACTAVSSTMEKT